MERWLLISNCQTTGLANSFNLLNQDIEVTPLDLWQFRAEPERLNASISEYFRVVVAPEIEGTEGLDLSQARNLTRLPPVSFSAYQPDSTYAGGSNGMMNSPLDAYHSLIVIAAHRKGLSVEDAASLFNPRFIEACGYLDYWTPQKDRLVETFADHGFDISDRIADWSRGGAFMYTVNHPRIHVLQDIARVVLRTFGVGFLECGVLPPDNLVNGVCWPVYPPIGERLGAPSSYRFKCFNTYRHIGLRPFIVASYDIYDREPPGAIHPIAESRPILDHVLSLI